MMAADLSKDIPTIVVVGRLFACFILLVLHYKCVTFLNSLLPHFLLLPLIV